MIPLYLAFYCATAVYASAAIMTLRYARGGDDSDLDTAKRLVGVGNVLLLAVFVARWAIFGLIPLTGLTDPLNLFIVLATGITLTVQRDENMKPLLVFYLPALALLAGVNATVAHRYLGEAPKDLNNFLLAAHVGLVFLAFSLFFVASLTSMAYMFKARHLKGRKTTGLFQRLPSLERIDRMLYRLISIGYPVFGLTLAVGFGWAFVERQILGPMWFVSPKILLSFAIALLYAVSFHTRRFGLLRGPKLAYLVFYGFTGVLITYLGLGLLDLAQVNFWDTPS